MPTIDSLLQSLIGVTKKEKRRYEGDVNYMCSFGMLPYLNIAKRKLFPGLFGVMLHRGGCSQSITEALHKVKLCQAHPTVLMNVD